MGGSCLATWFLNLTFLIRCTQDGSRVTHPGQRQLSARNVREHCSRPADAAVHCRAKGTALTNGST